MGAAQVMAVNSVTRLRLESIRTPLRTATPALAALHAMWGDFWSQRVFPRKLLFLQGLQDYTDGGFCSGSRFR